MTDSKMPHAYDCQKCGRGIPIDTVVADEVWRAISPTGDEGGLLCAACIADALAASDWSAIRMINNRTAPVVDTELEALLSNLQIEWQMDGENNGQPIYTWRGYGHEAKVAFGFDRKWGSKVDNAGHLFAEDRKAEALEYAERGIRQKLVARKKASERFDHDIAALRARTAQPVGVRVKPLTWHPGHGCTGSGLGLEYHMGETDPGMFELYSPFNFGPASKAECQAAAQADYEQRILSALLPEGGA